MLVARRRLLRQAVAAADIITLTAGFAAAYLIVGLVFHRKFESFASYAWLLAPINPIWLGCLGTFGLYCSPAYYSRRGLIGRLLQAQLLASLLLFSVMYLTRSQIISRLFLQVFLAVGFVFLASQKLVLSAYLNNARQRANLQRRKVVLVADPAIAEHYLHIMRTRVSVLADIVKVLAPISADSSGPRQAISSRLPGTVDDLPTLLQTQVIDEVIAVSPLDACVIERLSGWCAVRGILLRIWLELPYPTVGHWAAEYFGDGAFLVSLATVPQHPAYLGFKRMVDVLGAAVGMVFCGVVYLWYGWRLRRESGGSALFSQKRVGKNGRAFTLYKFRTMCAGAEQQKAALSVRNEMCGPMFKLKDDPRVTPTGRKLRRRHLDELPQFWNVLRGDMSLVGTRPPTDDETASYGERHHRRLSMKPGITGLWQIAGNSAIRDFEDVVKLDFDYIDQWALWLDFKILARTVTKVVRGVAW